MMLKIIDNWKEAQFGLKKITEATKPWFRYLNKKGLNE